MCPGLYLLVPKLTASRSARSWAAKQMRCQVIVLAVRRNWRRFWPAAASLLLLLLLIVVVAVLYSAVALFVVLAVLVVPVAQFLAAMTLRASFVRSLPVACRHWGLVCGTIGRILSKWRCCWSPSSSPPPPAAWLSLIAMRPLLAVWLKKFFAFYAKCVYSQVPAAVAAPRPSFACQSQCQINRFIELIHRGFALTALELPAVCQSGCPTVQLSFLLPFTKLQLAFMRFPLFCVVLWFYDHVFSLRLVLPHLVPVTVRAQLFTTYSYGFIVKANICISIY